MCRDVRAVNADKLRGMTSSSSRPRIVIASAGVPAPISVSKKPSCRRFAQAGTPCVWNRAMHDSLTNRHVSDVANTQSSLNVTWQQFVEKLVKFLRLSSPKKLQFANTKLVRWGNFFEEQRSRLSWLTSLCKLTLLMQAKQLSKFIDAIVVCERYTAFKHAGALHDEGYDRRAASVASMMPGIDEGTCHPSTSVSTAPPCFHIHSSIAGKSSRFVC